MMAKSRIWSIISRGKYGGPICCCRCIGERPSGLGEGGTREEWLENLEVDNRIPSRKPRLLILADGLGRAPDVKAAVEGDAGGVIVAREVALVLMGGRFPGKPLVVGDDPGPAEGDAGILGGG